MAAPGAILPGVQVEGHLYGDRVWFYDTRGRVRRMGVSAHPVDDTMVISLWQGDFCTGTFRLPARDAARLISTLAFGMTESIPPAGSGPDTPPPAEYRTWRHKVRQLSRTCSPGNRRPRTPIFAC